MAERCRRKIVFRWRKTGFGVRRWQCSDEERQGLALEDDSDVRKQILLLTYVHCETCCYWTKSMGRVLEMQMVDSVVKNSLPYRQSKCITVFTRARHWPAASLRIPAHLSLGLRSDLSPSGFPSKFFLLARREATGCSHLFWLLDVVKSCSK
jgi:hypothetical protein